VLIPLCGKSLDLAHLARQKHAVSQVVGVEGIPKAIHEFSHEHPDLNLHQLQESSSSSSSGKFIQYVGTNIVILNGDLFDLDETVTNGRFDAIFDRGSLVAIQPTLREQYINIMRQLLAPGGRILLSVFERRSGTDEDRTGPPFSVSESDMHQLYGTQSWVESVTLLDDNGEPNRTAGTAMKGRYFLIQAKG